MKPPQRKASPMTKLFFIIGITSILVFGLSERSSAACGGDCDSTYSSDVDSCHTQYGDDPEDADDLATCIQSAKDDYSSCVESCANQINWRSACLGVNVNK
jgi:hypothetical protein